MTRNRSTLTYGQRAMRLTPHKPKKAKRRRGRAPAIFVFARRVFRRYLDVGIYTFVWTSNQTQIVKKKSRGVTAKSGQKQMRGHLKRLKHSTTNLYMHTHIYIYNIHTALVHLGGSEALPPPREDCGCSGRGGSCPMPATALPSP